jgi:hypothetical protein
MRRHLAIFLAAAVLGAGGWAGATVACRLGTYYDLKVQSWSIDGAPQTLPARTDFSFDAFEGGGEANLFDPDAMERRMYLVSR